MRRAFPIFPFSKPQQKETTVSDAVETFVSGELERGVTTGKLLCLDAASLSATDHLTMKRKLVMLINQRAAVPQGEAGNAE